MQSVKWFQRNTEALVAGARAYLHQTESSAKASEASVKKSEDHAVPPPPMYPAANLFE